MTDEGTTPQCENCGHPVPTIEVEKVVEVKKELTLAERTEIINGSVEGELGRFLADRAPQLLDGNPVKVAIRELDRRLPRVTAVSHLVNEAVDEKKGTRRKRRRDHFDG